MTISFNSIPGPGTLRRPGVYSEVDNSAAVRGSQAVTYRRLLIGQKTSAGSATANVLVRVTSVPQAVTLFGTGSMLHGMVAAALAQDGFTELQVMPLADDAGGTAATGTLTFTGPATANGTAYLMIAGRAVNVGVTSADTATQVATAVAAAINADTTLPVTATSLVGAVTVTAKNKGLCGNDIDMRANYYYGQSLPAGIALTVTAMASGATNPTLTTAIANLGDEWLHVWANPYTDATSLAAIKTELTSRYQWDREIEGHCYTVKRGSLATVTALTEVQNNPHLTIVMGNDEPMPSYEKAAETASIAARFAGIDPARPLQNLGYIWCLPPASADRFTNEERNLLLFDGGATTFVDAGGVMNAERLITTYMTNAAGAPDVSYLDCETMFTLMYIRHDWRDYIKRKYPRHKLANDGTRYGNGQPVMTPNVMKAEAIVKFREWEQLGLVENIDDFKENLITERNVSDANRLDILFPPDLVNQLRIVGNKIQFRL